jgi:hypothetical protein
MTAVSLTQLVLAISLTVALFFSLRRVEMVFQFKYIFVGYFVLVASFTAEAISWFVLPEVMLAISHIGLALVALACLLNAMSLRSVLRAEDAGDQ